MSSQGERTPLLLPPSASCSPSQHDGPSSASKEAAGPTKAGRPDLLIRALITTFLWSLSIYIPAAAILDALRSYTCAAFYERNGELIPSWSINGTVGTPGPAIGHGHDQLTNIFSVEAGLGEHPCALPTIEAQVGHFVLITRLLYTGLGAASMLFFGPMLSSLGRKPLAILSLISSALVVLPNIVLPLGYPFSPAGTPLSISPNVSLAVILFANILGGVTGTTLLPELVFQVLIVDISTPATRSRYLTWLAAAKYVGASAGPALANLATELFPHAMAFGSSHSHSRGNRHLRHDHRDVAVAPPEKGWKTHTNTAPFWLTLLLCGAAVVYIWVAVPETVRRDEKEGEVSHKAVAEPGAHARSRYHRPPPAIHLTRPFTFSFPPRLQTRMHESILHPDSPQTETDRRPTRKIRLASFPDRDRHARSDPGCVGVHPSHDDLWIRTGLGA